MHVFYRQLGCIVSCSTCTCTCMRDLCHGFNSALLHVFSDTYVVQKPCTTHLQIPLQVQGSNSLRSDSIRPAIILQAPDKIWNGRSACSHHFLARFLEGFSSSSAPLLFFLEDFFSFSFVARAFFFCFFGSSVDFSTFAFGAFISLSGRLLLHTPHSN